MGDAKKLGMIREIEGNIDRFAGEAVKKKVMEGSKHLTQRTDKKKMAEWVKGAMDRLDSLVDEKTRIQIMEGCGYKCSEVNKRVIEQAKARRRKCASMEDFLESELRKPMKGTRLVREGNILYQFYTPSVFGMRCYCALVNSLEGHISQTYCHCSKAFVKRLWETVLERPVKVDLTQSVLTGDDECKFEIHL